jgi:Uma2 family endonuclease
MSALPRKRWTDEDYLTFELESEEKHEFVDGEIYLMSGASENHNIIVANILIALGVQIRQRPCKIYPSDMLVYTQVTGDYHYPDVSIVCGDSLIRREGKDILLNPTVIIEVLSPTTEQYDRGKKFQNYRTLDSLQEYLLISQDTQRIEHYVRQENNVWLFSDTTDTSAVIELPSISCTLALSDVYDKVIFEE